MTTALQWLKDNAWLLTAFMYVLANVANGLSKHPQAAGVLRKLVDAISWFTHADSPGTLKFPLQMSKAPGALQSPSGPNAILRALPILLLSGFSLPGCATGSTKAFGLSYAACMESKGLSAVGSVGQDVLTDLGGSTSSAVIEQQLEALAGKAGVDAVSCAVSVWLHPANPAALNPAGVQAGKAWLAKYAPAHA